VRATCLRFVLLDVTRYSIEGNVDTMKFLILLGSPLVCYWKFLLPHVLHQTLCSGTFSPCLLLSQ
jgi:hypothetical protein